MATADEPALRRAGEADAAVLAGVWLRSYDDAFPWIRRVHDDDEVRQWFAEVVLPSRETWLAERGPVPVGLMVLAAGEIAQLYVDPVHQGRGVGTRLVALAKDRFPAGLHLYTFAANAGARRFYERQGFRAVAFGDGSGNEEGEPDVRYEWP